MKRILDWGYPPDDQDVSKDSCPMCSIPLRDDTNYQARESLSRFDNTTMVCCHCGTAEAVGHIFTGVLTKGIIDFLSHSDSSKLTEWEWHVVTTLLYRGAMLGHIHQSDIVKKRMIKKMEEEE